MIIHAGQNLQAAIDAAAPGDLLEPEGGATFVGNFTAGVKPEGEPIRLVGAATLRTPNSQPALRTVGLASRWRFADLTFAAGASAGDIVQLGDGAIADLANVPTDFEFDRCTIQADTTAKRGLQLNSAETTLRRCRILGVKLQGQETQAIAGWNGPGPFLIEDCHLEAGSIGVLFGGAQPSIPNLSPSVITFRRNVVTRPLAMRTQSGWVVKNLFELKNARNVLVTGNTFEHNWLDSQHGFAIALTVRAQGLNAPWSTIRDVLFEHNVIRHTGSAFNILGIDNIIQNGQICPSVPMDGVTIRNNLVYDIDRVAWGSPAGALSGGVFLLIDGAPRNLVVEHNTAVGGVTGSIINLTGPPLSGFVFRRNIVQKQTKAAGFPYETYGVKGNNVNEGDPTFAAFAPDAVFTENVLAGCSPAAYGSRPGNVFPSVAALYAGFVDPSAGNYRHASIAAGCDQDAIDAACLPPPPPPPPEPTVEETIRGLAVESELVMADVGGDVSPQAAARQAIGYYREALLQALVS